MSDTENAIIRSWIDILAFDRLNDENKREKFWEEIQMTIMNMNPNHIKTFLYRYPDLINIVLNHLTLETYEGNVNIWRSAVSITLKFISGCGFLLWLEVYFSPDEIMENAIDIIKNNLQNGLQTSIDDVVLAFEMLSELISSNGKWDAGCGAKLGDVITAILSHNLSEREFYRIYQKISSIIFHFSKHLILALASSLPPHLKRIPTISTVIEFYTFLVQDRCILNHTKIVNNIIDITSQFSVFDHSTWRINDDLEQETLCDILRRYYQIMSIMLHRISDKYSSQSRPNKVVTQSLFPALCKMVSCPMNEECALASIQLLITLGRPVPSLSLSTPKELPKSSIKQEQLWASSDFSTQFRTQFTNLLESLIPLNLTSLVLGIAGMYQSAGDISNHFSKINPGLKRTCQQFNCLSSILKWRINTILGSDALSADEKTHLQDAMRILQTSKEQICQKFDIFVEFSQKSQKPILAYQYLASDSDNDDHENHEISRADIMHLHRQQGETVVGPFSASGQPNYQKTHDVTPIGPFSAATPDAVAPPKSYSENPFMIRNEKLRSGQHDLQSSASNSRKPSSTTNNEEKWLTKLHQPKILDLRPTTSTVPNTVNVSSDSSSKLSEERARRNNMTKVTQPEEKKEVKRIKRFEKTNEARQTVSGAYFGDVLDVHGEYNYEADLDKGYEHLFAQPQQDSKPKSSVPDVMSLLGSMMAAAGSNTKQQDSQIISADSSKVKDSRSTTPQPSVSQSIIKVSIDSFFATLLSLPLKSYTLPENELPPEKVLDVVVPNRFINEEHYIRTFQKLLEAEVEAILREFIIMNGQTRSGSNNRRDQREVRIWGGADINSRSSEMILPKIFVRCAMIIDRLGYEDTLSEVRVGTVQSHGNNRGANLAKDDLVVILHPNDDRDYKTVQSLLQAPHTLGIVLTQGKEQTVSSSTEEASNDYNHQSIIVLKGTLPPTEVTWTCIPLIGLSTHTREWTALHSIVSHNLMPLTPYILKAAPVVSAHKLSEMYRKLESSVSQIMVGADRLPRKEDMDRVNSIISILDGFQVDISVLKAVDMVNLCKQIESREGIDITIATRLKDLRAKWKHQVSTTPPPF